MNKITPRDKAKQLVVQYYGHTLGPKIAAKCAIICVEHIREQSEALRDQNEIEFWKQVRQELDKMERDF
ncbi:hypothetical protein [Sphingobacterium detergens]|uniref:hypothetical protein n=1 Tax=Sphingobacterium detergens TaxID=1145106 RepID=UPI003AABD9A5